MTDKKTEALKLALEAAYLAGFNASGEDYNGEWPFADKNKPEQDEGWCEERDEYIHEALAEQPAQQQEPEPDRVKFERHWRKTRGDKKANRELPRHPLQPQTYIQDSANRHWVTWQAAVRSVAPPASKPLTDEQILNLVPGLQDCLCDPWDCNNSGDYYASIPKDMIRLARAIEAAHGINEKNHE